MFIKLKKMGVFILNIKMKSRVNSKDPVRILMETYPRFVVIKAVLKTLQSKDKLKRELLEDLIIKELKK